MQSKNVNIEKNPPTDVSDLSIADAKGAFRGHQGFVVRLAFLGNDRLVSCSHDRSVRVWDANSLECRVTLQGHQAEVVGLAVHPSELVVASGGEDGVIRIWDLESGNCTSEFRRSDPQWTRLAYSPDGKLLLACGDRVALWDVNRRKPIRRMGGEFSVAAISPDGSTLAIGDMDGEMEVRPAPNSVNARRFDVSHAAGVNAIAFRADCLQVATVAEDRVVRLFDATNGQKVVEFGGHTERTRDVTFHPANEFLVTIGDRVRVWDLATHKLKASCPGQMGLAFSPDGRMLATSVDNEIYLWDFDSLVKSSKRDSHE